MSAVWWMLWAQLCLVIGLLEMIRGLLFKTHAKASADEDRIQAIIIGPVKTANTLAPLTTHVTALTSLAGNTLLPTLAQEFSPTTFGNPAGSSGAQLQSWAIDATARFNQIYSTMQGTNLWT